MQRGLFAEVCEELGVAGVGVRTKGEGNKGEELDHTLSVSKIDRTVYESRNTWTHLKGTSKSA